MLRIPDTPACRNSGKAVSETDALMDILMASRMSAPLALDGKFLAQRWGWSAGKAAGFVDEMAQKGHIETRKRRGEDYLVLPGRLRMAGDGFPKKERQTPKKPDIFYIAAAEEFLDTKCVQLKIGITARTEKRMKEQSSYVTMTPLCEIRTSHARQLERMVKAGFSDHIPDVRSSTETIKAPDGMGYQALFNAIFNAARHYLALIESMPKTSDGSVANFNKCMTADYKTMLRALARHHIELAAGDETHTNRLHKNAETEA